MKPHLIQHLPIPMLYPTCTLIQRCGKRLLLLHLLTTSGPRSLVELADCTDIYRQVLTFRPIYYYLLTERVFYWIAWACSDNYRTVVGHGGECVAAAV